MNDYVPEQAKSALIAWGVSIKTSRKRRGWSRQNFATRLGTSVSTLKRLEEGSPGVGISIFASALWLLGMLDQVGESFDVYHDRIGISMDIERFGDKKKDAF